MLLSEMKTDEYWLLFKGTDGVKAVKVFFDALALESAAGHTTPEAEAKLEEAIALCNN